MRSDSLAVEVEQELGFFVVPRDADVAIHREAVVVTAWSLPAVYQVTALSLDQDVAVADALRHRLRDGVGDPNALTIQVELREVGRSLFQELGLPCDAVEAVDRDVQEFHIVRKAVEGLPRRPCDG